MTEETEKGVHYRSQPGVKLVFLAPHIASPRAPFN